MVEFLSDPFKTITYLGDTDNGVGDSGGEGTDSGRLSVTSVPHLNSDDEVLVGSLTSLHFHDSNVNWEMAEILLNLTSWTFDHDLSGFAGNLNYRRKLG